MDMRKLVLLMEWIFSFLGLCLSTTVFEKSAKVMFFLTLAGVPFAFNACILESRFDKNGKVCKSLSGRVDIRYCLFMLVTCKKRAGWGKKKEEMCYCFF